MLWMGMSGDFSAFTLFTGWLTIIVIFGSTKNGNGLATQPHQNGKFIKIGPDLHSRDLTINSLDQIKYYNNNQNSNNNNSQNLIVNNKKVISKITNNNNFYTQQLNNTKSNTHNSSYKISVTTTTTNSRLLNNNSANKSVNDIESDKLVDNEEVENEIKIMNFNTENSTQVTYQVGSVALIPCSIQNLGEEMTVSWIRRKDYHLITVGSTTYSSDERFIAIHLQDSEDWMLQIKFVQTRDNGVYECQVSTHPPTSIFVHLDVVEARAEMPGPIEKYLKPGSMLRLSCKVLHSMELPTYLFWYHNNRMINYDVHRGVNVSTEADNRYSELVIQQTSIINSGNYTCAPSNAVPASILVHILNAGENPAAMQHGEHGGGIVVIRPSVILILIFLICYFVNMEYI